MHQKPYCELIWTSWTIASTPPPRRPPGGSQRTYSRKLNLSITPALKTLLHGPDFYPLRYSRPGLPEPGSTVVDKNLGVSQGFHPLRYTRARAGLAESTAVVDQNEARILRTYLDFWDRCFDTRVSLAQPTCRSEVPSGAIKYINFRLRDAVSGPEIRFLGRLSARF